MFNEIEKKIFSEVYTFMVKEYYGDGSEGYWIRVLNEAKAIVKKYDNRQIAVNMTVAVLNNLDEVIRKRNLNKG